MKALNSAEVALVSGGQDEPNPIQVVGGAGSIAAGVGIIGQAGGGATAIGAAPLGVPVAVGVLGGVGGYMIGDYVEQKTGIGSATGDFVGYWGTTVYLNVTDFVSDHWPWK